ncbi:hypothetical protein BX592_104216 [Paraburkholderia rhizosphaerae]|uniref:Uncharacterized protein n=1 Tax=Paraburkholderia rhizosphaerae TaxID=480658 RepID=A0A4R8LXI1_9BURK|nr:hypothetical protein BX592_104216 [Paraburkholderia rhizosphaerae]
MLRRILHRSFLWAIWRWWSSNTRACDAHCRGAFAELALRDPGARYAMRASGVADFPVARLARR